VKGIRSLSQAYWVVNQPLEAANTIHDSAIKIIQSRLYSKVKSRSMSPFGVAWPVSEHIYATITFSRRCN